MNLEHSDIYHSEWEFLQKEEATQTSNISIDRVLKPDKPRLPLPRNLSTVDKSANTSFKSSNTVFEFCQVIENPDYPGDVRIVNDTFDDLKRSPADSKSTLSDPSEIRSYYRKDIIKPFLKPDFPESEEEILNSAIDSLSEDFPNYMPCEFPGSDTERIRACLSLGKLDACTSINTNKSGMDNCPVEPAGIPEDTKIEIEITRPALNCLVDAQEVIASEVEDKAVPLVKNTCPCPQIDECIKPVVEICHSEDKKDTTKEKENTVSENVCQGNKASSKKSCVCIKITTSSKHSCVEKKSKESIKEPTKELNVEPNKESHSKPDCGMESSKEPIEEPIKELNKQLNKEPHSQPDCGVKSSTKPIKEPPLIDDCFKKTSKESMKEPNKESPLKFDCGKKASKESLTKITIECQNSLPPNVSNPVSPEKCIDEDGPTVEGFVDALDTHTKTLTTIKIAMKDFVYKVCSYNANDKEPEPPKSVSLIQRVFDVSDVDKNMLVPKMSNVIKNMKIKVDSTISMISDSIDNMTPEGLKTSSVHNDFDLNTDETQDVGNNSPPAPVTVPILPTPVPVSNSMFYTIKDKIVSMFREPKSDISTRTSTFTNTSLESNNGADSSKTSR